MMSNSKALREAILKQADWRKLPNGRWLPDGLYCFKCGKRSKPAEANNLNCPFCGGKLIEVQS